MLHKDGHCCARHQVGTRKAAISTRCHAGQSHPLDITALALYLLPRNDSLGARKLVAPFGLWRAGPERMKKSHTRNHQVMLTTMTTAGGNGVSLPVSRRPLPRFPVLEYKKQDPISI
jgi:hypothetical protein